MKKIIILGAFRFPKGDAAAKRVYGFGLYLQKNDYEVEYLSWGNESDYMKRKFYNNFSYISLDEFNNGKGNLIYKFFNYLKIGFKTLKFLKNQNLNNVSSIIAYHGSSIFLLRLWFFCKKSKINLILDITEWYSSYQLAGGKFGPISIDTAIRMRIINPFIGNLIVISDYLYETYQNKTKNIIKIPFLVNITNNVNLQLDINTNIKLLYIGNPGKKDQLNKLIEAINLFNKTNNRKFFFDVFGITENEYIKNMSIENTETQFSPYINFKGKVDNSLVEELYKNYHFSILIRPSERYAIAGFPTKLVESLSYAVPVIASNVGDIKNYIIEKETGFLLNKIKINDILEIFDKIILLSNEDYSLMRKKSFEIAKDNFDYTNEMNLIDFIKKTEYSEVNP